MDAKVSLRTTHTTCRGWIPPRQETMVVFWVEYGGIRKLPSLKNCLSYLDFWNLSLPKLVVIITQNKFKIETVYICAFFRPAIPAGL